MLSMLDLLQEHKSLSKQVTEGWPVQMGEWRVPENIFVYQFLIEYFCLFLDQLTSLKPPSSKFS